MWDGGWGDGGGVRLVRISMEGVGQQTLIVVKALIDLTIVEETVHAQA